MEGKNSEICNCALFPIFVKNQNFWIKFICSKIRIFDLDEPTIKRFRIGCIKNYES